MFTSDVYETIRDGCLRSAQTVVPNIVDLIHPSSVVDYGCGEGLWLSVFAEHGCEILGLDNGSGLLSIPESRFQATDLTTCPHQALDQFDLAICLEVAEHLPEHRADWLVAELCASADVVLFSAAIPGQGGTGHINEQWPDYWYSKFADQGYEGTGALRWTYWDRAPDEIENWYAQNLFIYATPDAVRRRGVDLISRFEDLFHSHLAEPLRLVHPVLWDSRR